MAREIIHPCAACKHLRKKCTSSCVLAPHFPKDNLERFLKVHSVFGKRNVTKMLKNLDVSHHEQVVESLVYEADARLKDPIHGCAGPAYVLQKSRLTEVQTELKSVKNELGQYLSPQVIEFVLSFPDCFGFTPNVSPDAELTAQQIHNLEVLKQKLLSGPDGDDGLTGFQMDVNVPVGPFRTVVTPSDTFENGSSSTRSDPVGGGLVSGSGSGGGGLARFQMDADVPVCDSGLVGLAGSQMLPHVPPADAASVLPSSRVDTFDNGSPNV